MRDPIEGTSGSAGDDCLVQWSPERGSPERESPERESPERASLRQEPPLQDPTARVSRALLELQTNADELLQALECQTVAAAVALQVAEDLGTLVTRLRAAHTLAVGQARASGMWAVQGYPSSTAWLRDTHRLDGGRARAMELTASWLNEHPITQEAYTSGRITADHVSAIRRVTAACSARAQAYPLFEEALLEVAANADPLRTLAVLKAWADTVDASAADKESSRDTDRRSLHLSQVANGWDLRGWLPAAQGAELAGILNEIMETRRRQSDDDALDPPATRRADALLDLVRAAAHSADRDPEGTSASGGGHDGGLLGPGARSRSRVIVTVPLQRLLDYDPTQLPEASARDTDADLPADPITTAGAWRCGNGPGDGFLAMREVLRLSCDAEIQRLVLDPHSQPLDIGRTTRVVPPHLRTALELRDRGCIMPGCRRPPSWCEAHHIEHWAQGGKTAIENLALICSRHHHELHNGTWRIIPAEAGHPTAQRLRIPATRPRRVASSH